MRNLLKKPRERFTAWSRALKREETTTTITDDNDYALIDTSEAVPSQFLERAGVGSRGSNVRLLEDLGYADYTVVKWGRFQRLMGPASFRLSASRRARARRVDGRRPSGSISIVCFRAEIPPARSPRES